MNYPLRQSMIYILRKVNKWVINIEEEVSEWHIQHALYAVEGWT